MKRWVSAFLGLALIALAGCGGGGTPAGSTPAGGGGSTPAQSTSAGGGSGGSGGGASSEGEPYKIGAILDITGGGSTLAIPERNTLQMLAKQANDQGGITGPDGKKHKLELIIEDNKGQESETVLLANKLIKTEKVPVLIGASQSGTTLAMIKTVQEAQVPLVSLATSIQVVTPIADRKWVFKTPWNDATIVSAVVEEMKSRGFTKAAFLSANNAYGDSALKEFSRMAPEAGIQIVLEDKFDVGVKDLTPLMNRVKSSDAQAVVVWALSPETAVAVRGYKALQLTQELYVSHGVATPQFLELAGDAAEGANMAAGKALVADEIPADDPQRKALDQFNQAYETAYKDPISSFGGHAWDSFQVVVNALSKAGPDPAKIRDALESETKELVGITGIFNFTPADHTGLDTRGLAILEVKGGEFKLVRTFTQK